MQTVTPTTTTSEVKDGRVSGGYLEPVRRGQMPNVSQVSSIYPSRYQPGSNRSDDNDYEDVATGPPQGSDVTQASRPPWYAEPYQFGQNRPSEPVYHEIKD